MKGFSYLLFVWALSCPAVWADSAEQAAIEEARQRAEIVKQLATTVVVGSENPSAIPDWVAFQAIFSPLSDPRKNLSDIGVQSEPTDSSVLEKLRPNAIDSSKVFGRIDRVCSRALKMSLVDINPKEVEGLARELGRIESFKE